MTRLLELHLTNLEPGTRQPRLAMMADGPANTKTRERTEGAASTVQAMHGDIAVLPTALIPTRCVLPASVMTEPDLQHPLVQGRMRW